MKSASRSEKKIVVFSHAAGNTKLGPNARWARFAEGLAKFDIGVTLVGASYFHKYRDAIKASFLKPASSSVDGASFVHLWSPKYGGGFKRILNQMIFSLSILLMHRSDFTEKNYDYVVASSPHPFVVLGALFWAKRFKAKFVYESRDLWPLLLIQHVGMSRLHPYVLLTGVMEHLAVKYSDFILTPKEFENHYYSEKYSIDKVYWVPNTSKQPSKNVCKEHFGQSMSIIYSGSLQSIYNVDQLIVAIRMLPDPRLSLTILGDGPELRHLRELAGSDSRISFAGWLTGDSYSKALDDACVCFFSTADMDINQYGFSSNKISDYVSRGKPILAHVSQGAEGLVRSKSALQSNAGDIEALSKNIQRFLDEPQLIDDMGAASLQYYSDFYKYDSVVQRLAKLLAA